MDPVSAQVVELIAARGRGAAADLARHLGVRQPTVSRWAAGVNAPSREYWPRIEEYFGLEPGTIGVEAVRITERIAALEAGQSRLEALVRELTELVQDVRGDR